MIDVQSLLVPGQPAATYRASLAEMHRGRKAALYRLNQLQGPPELWARPGPLDLSAHKALLAEAGAEARRFEAAIAELERLAREATDVERNDRP